MKHPRRPLSFLASSLSYVLWNTLSAYHPKLFAPDQGIFRAWWPWNGHYELGGRTWVSVWGKIVHWRYWPPLSS